MSAQNQINSTEAMSGQGFTQQEILKLTPEGEAAAASLSVMELAHRHDCGDENCDHTAQDEIDNPTGSVPAPPKLTKKQIGQLRRQYFTVVHGTVKACGHPAKFSATKQPNNNCVYCWTAYFSANDPAGKPYVDLISVHKVLAEKGIKGLEKQYGTKFMRNFHGFLALYLKEQRAENQPAPTQEMI